MKYQGKSPKPDKFAFHKAKKDPLNYNYFILYYDCYIKQL